MAKNCFVPPAGTVALAGVTVIDCSTAGVTVSTDVPKTPDRAALIKDVPGAREMARPCDPTAFETVATDVAADAQVTWLVKFCVELSE